MKIKIKDGRETLWQWDTGRVIILEEPCDVIHFANMQHGMAISVKVEKNEAKIPDVLLQSGAPLYCYAFVGSVENGYTDYSQQFVIEKKPKPSDYVFSPSEQHTLKDLQDLIEKASFVAEITPIVGGYRITLDDIKGKKTFDIMNGKNGENGKPGMAGANGISCTHFWDGTTLFVTSASGTSSADLKGDKGDKPENGVDYNTEADKAELVEKALQTVVPLWSGGNY